jgi:transposase
MRPMTFAPPAADPLAELEDSLTVLLTDDQWDAIRKLPQVGRMHPVGRKPTDDREVLEAVLWVMRYQARWQDLPSDYPSPRTCQRRLARWQETGQWEHVWQTYIDLLDDETLHEWGAVFMNVILAQGAAKNGNGRGAKTRIGRPPFWMPMAHDFWRRTWSDQPAESRQRLADHIDEVFAGQPQPQEQQFDESNAA